MSLPACEPSATRSIFIPVNEIVTNRAMELLADGRPRLDDCGVEIMRQDVSPIVTEYGEVTLWRHETQQVGHLIAQSELEFVDSDLTQMSGQSRDSGGSRAGYR